MEKILRSLRKYDKIMSRIVFSLKDAVGSLSEGRTTASICAPAVILEPLLPLPTHNAFRVLMESRHGSLRSRLLLTTGEERRNYLYRYYEEIVKSTVLSDQTRL